jgi:hypothetical protein
MFGGRDPTTCLCIVLGQVTGSITDHLEGHFIIWYMYRPKLSLTVFDCYTSSHKIKYMPFCILFGVGGIAPKAVLG